MELNILEESKRKLVFELKGEGHTLCNILRQELLADKDVQIAAYTINHPLVNIPKFILETSTKKDPKKALKEAITRLVKKNKDLKKQFAKIK